MTAYYNENDPRAAAWLRELIKRGQIAPGDVDERSIEDVTPNELRDYKQCHFFAGVGGWSYALRLAGVADDTPVWTGSCPCQPFSAAGKGKGFADERHLWPAWHYLIEQLTPSVVFGEQVASPAGLGWFDLVYSDMEEAGYTCAAVDLCAAGVGAPHIRQRLYWVAHSDSGRRQEQRGSRILNRQWKTPRNDTDRCSVLGHAGGERGRRHTGEISGAQGSTEGGLRCELNESESSESARYMEHAPSDGRVERRPKSSGRGSLSGRSPCILADTDGRDARAEGIQRGGQHRLQPQSSWTNCDWISCRDGKSRPVESGSFPLAHGVPGRVGLLRGYGNAIVPQVAAAFIEATGVV